MFFLQTTAKCYVNKYKMAWKFWFADIPHTSRPVCNFAQRAALALWQCNDGSRGAIDTPCCLVAWFLQLSCRPLCCASARNSRSSSPAFRLPLKICLNPNRPLQHWFFYLDLATVCVLLNFCSHGHEKREHTLFRCTLPVKYQAMS